MTGAPSGLGCGAPFRVSELLLDNLIQIGEPLIQPTAGPARGADGSGNAKKKVGWISLGCPKNLVDSEGMLGGLDAAGYSFTRDIEDADAVVVNTCGFIDAARDESIGALRQSLGQNRDGKRRRVIAVGCLAQRYGAELLSEVEGLDAVVGMGQQDDLPDILAEALGEGAPGVDLPAGGRLRVFDPAHYFPEPERRIRLTQPWTAYVKISDGCDNPCTFCSIPLMRGKMRSRPAADIEAEVRFLAAQGVQEIVLIAQDSTHYGDDLGEGDIAALLRRLAKIEGPRWIRLMYAYPTRVNDRLIDVIASEDRICNYIDMPLQHASDPMLAAMKRPGTSASYLRLLERLREKCPDLTIRTTMIIGFPGETEKDFENLLHFVEEAQFDRLGAFRYSPEPGTPAALYADMPSARVVERRYAQLMRVQQRISLDRNRRWVGRVIPVLVESQGARGTWICRSERDAPDIDGKVLVSGARGETELKAGDFINVTITGAEPYDLIARFEGVVRATETLCQKH